MASEQEMVPKGMEVGGLGLIRDIFKAASEDGLSINPVVRLFLDTNAHLGVSVTESTSNHEKEIVVEFLDGNPTLKLMLGLKTATITSIRMTEEKVTVSIDGFPDFDLDVVQ